MELFEHGSATRTPMPGKGVVDFVAEEPASGLIVGALLLGAPVVVLALFATGVLGDRPSTQALAAVPLVGISPVMMLALAIAGIRARRRRARARAAHPHEPAFADHAWDPAGARASGFRGPLIALAVVLTVTLTLISAHVGVTYTWNPIKGHALLAMFDLLTLFAWRRVLVAFAWARKFGQASLAFAACPYRPGAPVQLRWHAGARLGTARHGSFTLRCLTEEEGGFVCVWMQAWSFAAPTELDRTTVDLRYTPPAEAPTTCLSGHPQTYWELEVRLDFPGLDFVRTYLVPVYAG